MLPASSSSITRLLLIQALIASATAMAAAVRVNTATVFAGAQCAGAPVHSELILGEVDACVSLQFENETLALAFDCGAFDIHLPEFGCTGPAFLSSNLTGTCLPDAANNMSMMMECGTSTDALRLDFRYGGCGEPVTNSTFVRLGECTPAGAHLYPDDNLSLHFNRAYMVTKDLDEYVVQYYYDADCIGSILVDFPPVALEACASAGSGNEQTPQGLQSVSVHEVLPVPTGAPSTSPSAQPSTRPSALPSAQPSTRPSAYPSATPSTRPSAHPSATPSAHPSATPSTRPSARPSVQPSSAPSTAPSPWQSSSPSVTPSATPTASPSLVQTIAPSTLVETFQPSAAPQQQLITREPTTSSATASLLGSLAMLLTTTISLAHLI